MLPGTPAVGARGKIEHNVIACFYSLKSPDGITYKFRNLNHFVRENPNLFPPGYAEEKKISGSRCYAKAERGLRALFASGDHQRFQWRGWQAVWKKDRLGKIVWERSADQEDAGVIAHATEKCG